MSDHPQSLTGPSRRDVLLTSVALAGAAALPAVAIAAPAAAPNIVWIVCHDIHAPLIGTYGNSLAKTPTIDRLAAEGTRYDNAFSVAPVCAPSRFALLTGLYPDSCGPAHHMRGIGHVPAEFKPLPILMREAGYYCTNNVFTDYNCDLDPDKIWDECSITAHWRNRPAGKPFFAVYNYLITHESRALHFEDKDLITDPAKVVVPPYLPDMPEIRKALARNIDMVNNQDVAVAKLLSQLTEDGLANNTVVFFVADHGGVAPRSKRYCYEEGLRVPLIVRVPDGLKPLSLGAEPGKPSRRIVSHIDIAPTTLALAGQPQPGHMPGQPFLGRAAEPRTVAFSGRNRMDERYDMVRTARDERYRYIRNYAPHRIYGLHNAYTWQLEGYQAWERAHLAGSLNAAQERFWREKPAEELYDLEADPHQLTNLAADPAHRDRLEALSGALEAHMIATNDNGFIPEGTSAEGYAESRKAGAFPIADVLPLARKAIARDPANAAGFVAGLKHSNEVMRFWAAQGLLMLDGPSASRQVLAVALATEVSPHVRCVLAEALGKAGDPATAATALAAVLESDLSKRVKLMALEALTYLPVEAVRAARPAIEKVVDLKEEYTLDAYHYLRLRLDGSYTPSTQTYYAIPATGPAGKPMGDPRI